jgi:hypothetical protein
MNSVAKRLQLKADVVHHAQSQARPCHGEMSEDDAQRLARNRWLQPDRGDYLCSRHAEARSVVARAIPSSALSPLAILILVSRTPVRYARRR